jgi:hypothetical protein
MPPSNWLLIHHLNNNPGDKLIMGPERSALNLPPH